MSDKVSQGARELVSKLSDEQLLIRSLTGNKVLQAVNERAAALIDQELALIVRAAQRLEHNTGCPAKNKWTADASKECTCGLSALLAKWTVRG